MESSHNRKLLAAEQQVKLLQEITRSREVVLHSRRKIVVEIRETAPIFVSKLQVTQGPLIIVSAEKELAISPEPTLKVEQPKESNLLEVTGTPLPAPFTADDLKLLHHRVGDFAVDNLPESEKFQPIGNNQAREVLRLYAERIADLCNKQKLKPDDVCHVYVPCDATDGMKIALLQTTANGTQGFSYMFASQERKCEEEQVKLLRQRALKQAEENVKPNKSKLNNQKLECVHMLQWSKLERYVTLEDGTGVIDGNGISVKIAWTEAIKNLNVSDNLPLSTTPAVIEAQLDYQYKKWESGNLKSDLMFLTELLQCVNNNVIDSNHTFTSTVPGTLDVSAQNFGAQLLHNARAQPYWSTETQEADCSDFKNGMKQVKSEIRRNMDITDFIWNALKHCKTLGSLGSCLETIFEECIEQNPFMLPNNNSRVSKIIISMPSVRTAPQTSLQLRLTAELLLEIGYLKFVRDIVFLCQVSGARSKGDAEKVCGVELTDWAEKLARLEHAQQCIEFLIQADLLLCLNAEAISSILSCVLDKSGPLVKVNVKAADIINLLKGVHPPLRVWNFKATKTCTKVETKRIAKTDAKGEERKQGKQVEYENIPVERTIVLAQATAKFVVSKQAIFPWLTPIITDKPSSDIKMEQLPTVDTKTSTLARVYGSVHCVTVNQIYTF